VRRASLPDQVCGEATETGKNHDRDGGRRAFAQTAPQGL
jgi:hypothetical protein